MAQATRQRGKKMGEKASRNTLLSRKDYDKELRRLQVDLVQLEEWIRHRGLRVVVLFEGRDTAGKGGFCSDEEYDDFMRTCPQFERMLVRSGIILVKYWLSVSDDEQERRFLARINDPSKRWKLSPMDMQARARWVDYSEAKDQMFAFCDIKDAPWHVVETDNKRAAHLNLISHFLSLIPHKEVPHEDIKLPPRQKRSYNRPPKSSQRMVPMNYEVE
jgi:polyphosphate kinase 2 (PPK2 family)